MEMTDPVTVYETTTAFHAEVIRNALAAEGIPCILAGIEQASTAAVPGTVVQIQVSAAQAEQARQLIETHETPADEPAEEPAETPELPTD